MQAYPTVAAPSPEALYETKRLALQAAARRGTDWFFWIAGLSVVNTIIYLTGSTTSFIVGLGITQVIDVLVNHIAQSLSGSSVAIFQFVGILVDLFIMGLFAGAGFLARKQVRWVVIVGMLLYVLDGILYVAAGEWLAILFHLWALFGLWNGFRALTALKKLQAAAVTAYQPEPVIYNPMEPTRRS